MATSYSTDVLNIYSLYRASYPPESYVAATEDAILVYIDRKLKDLPALPKNDQLDTLINTYVQNKNAGGDAILGAIGGGAAETAKQAFSFFRTGFGTMWTGFWKGIRDFFGTELNKIWSNFVAADERGFENLMKGFVDNGFVSQESADFLLSVFAKSKAFSGLAPTAIVIGIIITLVFNSSGIMMGDFIKLLKSKFTPEQLGAGDLIRAQHLAPELSTEINKKLRENGLSEDDIKLAKISAYQTLDLFMVRDCFWRKIITQAEAVNRLEELGYTPKRIQEIMSTWQQIPSPQDLFWMVGKEAFEPDQIAKFGLDKEFPTEQVEWLEKQGYSESWAKKYWSAHWDYPSEGRVLDLFHRGIINDDDLDAFYRVIEIPVYWREKLKKASYSLYTRIDLRRLHDLHLITEKDVYDNFRGEGYDDEHARKMVEFYINYNELNDKDLSLGQIKAAYEADLITRAQAMKALIGLQYTEDQADFILKFVEYDEDIKIQKLRIKSIAKMYKGGLYDVPTTRGMLTKLGVEAKWIEVYITQWEEEKLHDEKIPDKNELLTWYSSSVISLSDFVYYMHRLGYADSSIQLYARINAPPKA